MRNLRSTPCSFRCPLWEHEGSALKSRPSVYLDRVSWSASMVVVAEWVTIKGHSSNAVQLSAIYSTLCAPLPHRRRKDIRASLLRSGS